jgi:hypothetical protein
MDLICGDCGHPTDRIKPENIVLGSDTREPGEVVCGGCASRRSRMVRQLESLPDNLTDIRAKRMVRR